MGVAIDEKLQVFPPPKAHSYYISACNSVFTRVPFIFYATSLVNSVLDYISLLTCLLSSDACFRSHANSSENLRGVFSIYLSCLFLGVVWEIIAVYKENLGVCKIVYRQIDRDICG